MLKDKVAVIYGAGGAIGGAVARAFAGEGAKVFLTGRLRAPVEAVAKDIVSAGGSAEAAEVDAVDEQAMDRHLQSVIDTGGPRRHLVQRGRHPEHEYCGRPAGRAGCRAVLPGDHGLHDVVLPDRTPGRTAHDPEQVRGDHDRHRTPLADGHPVGGRLRSGEAAKEALTRDLSAELAPQGIRVVGLRPQGMPETRTIKEAFEPRAEATGMTWEQFQEFLASRTHPRRLMTLAEMADVAVFMASDKASGMTGTTVNLTMGSLDD